MLRLLTKLFYVSDIKESDRSLTTAVLILLEVLRKNTKYLRMGGVPDEIRLERSCFINLFSKPTKLQTNRDSNR